MGKVRKHSGGKKAQNGPREVTPEVFQDKYAANRLGFTKPEYQGVSKGNKTRNRKLAKGGLPLKKKKERVYTEKELGIPKLNTALDPVGVKVKGKKGKKFVDDTSMQLILAEVQQQANEAQASKLERARQIEAIREAKRKEMEEREQQQKDKVEGKKSELKKKGRSKKKSSEPAGAAGAAAASSKPQKPGKKRVAFAV